MRVRARKQAAEPWTIWSHSWYVHYELIGVDGPDFNKYGGIRIGDSNYWVGKYTVQPENGGVGVFAHEFGHDLGLPDLYATDGGDNGTGFWTLMSSGSWLNEGKDDIGSKPNHMGAWEKFQLGWLNYDVAPAGKTSSFKLGPSMTNTRQAQAVIVVLPKKTVVTEVGKPFAGANYYYSGDGDNFDRYMSKKVTLTPNSNLSAMVRYNTELDYDYAYLVVSTDGGTTWTGVKTNLSTDTNPNGSNRGSGITGSSKGWVALTADLSAYTGDVLLGFRYQTDANTSGFGFMVDEISVNGGAADGAETDAGWTFKPTTGFHVTTGVENKLFNHYYIAEFRQYRGYDATLQDRPVQLRFHRRHGQLGRALPVSGRPVDQLLGHVTARTTTPRRIPGRASSCRSTRIRSRWHGPTAPSGVTASSPMTRPSASRRRIR